MNSSYLILVLSHRNVNKDNRTPSRSFQVAPNVHLESFPNQIWQGNAVEEDI